MNSVVEYNRQINRNYLAGCGCNSNVRLNDLGCPGCGGKCGQTQGLNDNTKPSEKKAVSGEEASRIIREEVTRTMRPERVIPIMMKDNAFTELQSLAVEATENSVGRICTTGVENTLKNNIMWIVLAVVAYTAGVYWLAKR
jgi:hypothetical protein